MVMRGIFIAASGETDAVVNYDKVCEIVFTRVGRLKPWVTVQNKVISPEP